MAASEEKDLAPNSTSKKDKPRKHRGKTIAIVILAVVAAFLWLDNSNLRQENERLQDDLHYEMTKSTTTSSSSGTNASTDATASSDTAASTDASASSSSGALYDISNVDPTVKEFGDSYEQWVDSYVAFMQKYANASATDQAQMMGDYSTMLQQEAEMSQKADEMNNEESSWNTDTQQYWIDLYSRCSQKMLSVAQN